MKTILLLILTLICGSTKAQHISYQQKVFPYPSYQLSKNCYKQISIQKSDTYLTLTCKNNSKAIDLRFINKESKDSSLIVTYAGKHLTNILLIKFLYENNKLISIAIEDGGIVVILFTQPLTHI